MGNKGSQLGDEPTSVIAQKNLQHFDHNFKADLHTSSGPFLAEHFGACKFAKRPIEVVCKAYSMDIIETVGLSSKTQIEILFEEIVSLSWDHANSEVKLVFHKPDENYLIVILANSIEFEQEMKLRLAAAATSNRNIKIPASSYVGMFAGATKPKPFQRKRPNLSKLPAGKLPTLHDMRKMAIELHNGSYRPCPKGESRRMEIALQHIYEGCNTFPLLTVRGNIENHYGGGAVLIITDECLVYKPRGVHSEIKTEFYYEDIKNWEVVDNDYQYRTNTDSGIDIILNNDEHVYFGVPHIRDVKHTLEYFWNTFYASNGQLDHVKLGSTHGRPIVSVHTLSGEVAPPEAPVGSTEVIDQDGLQVRPGNKVAPRRSSITQSVMTKELKVVPMENKDVKPHWHKVVMHQGWLLKQGGVGVGDNKSWIKRYFVLYKTSQGHFLVYYSDFTECPMYTSEKNHRNIVDLSKATFIRPGSNKADNPDTPPYCFDIVTTEREWTLCAESQENVQRWLKLLTRAVDEDVAILPDEELVFYVKPKLDPLQNLPAAHYSTALKVSAQGVSVTAPDAASKDNAEKEFYFWVYTDFYKWSLMCPDGKFALLVNVFADSSFSRRNEFVFRTKEAQRLATAIEYFIEKFMTVMRIRLETVEGAFDQVEDEQSKVGMHHMDQADQDQLAQEMDLLDMGGESSPLSRSTKKTPQSTANVDAFGSDPFGEDTSSSTPVSLPPQPQSSGVDLLSAFTEPAAPAPPAALASADPFGDDPFGSDPFGSSFGAPAASVPAGPKLAPPLTPNQIGQHQQWFVNALASAGGQLYDDGTLKIASKIEVRGSQCRVTLFYQNQSPGTINDLVIELKDSAGLLRADVPAVAKTIAGLGQTTQIIMVECMKPIGKGPELFIEYVDTLQGKHSNTIPFPLVVTSFNEPIPMTGADFMAKWGQLTAPGQELQQILKPNYPINPQMVQAALVQTLKFGRISDIPDATDYVIYGVATLRTGAKAANGDKISVGCLTKIEMNVQSNAIRVTLRTVHPAATQAVMDTAKTLLS